MPIYIVTEYHKHVFRVIASDEDDARSKAMDMWDSGEVTEHEDHDTVELLYDNKEE